MNERRSGIAIIVILLLSFWLFVFGQIANCQTTGDVSFWGSGQQYKLGVLDSVRSSFTAGSIPFVLSDGRLTQDNANLFWDNTNKRLGIGTSTPSVRLAIEGQIQITGGSPGAGKVLTSNATGIATWETPSGYTYARVTGSNVTTTGQTLVNITGLSIALLANSVYEFEAILSVQSSTTAGNQYGVNFSQAGATVEAQISGTLAATSSRSDRISILNTATPTYVTSGATGGIRIQGIVTTGANAGNLTIQHLKVTSGTSTVFINSFLKVIKIL